MKRLLLLVTSIFLLLSDLMGQKAVSVSGIDFSYQIKNEQIEIELSAPTTGWVGIGFNDKNSIVGSDLLLFHIVDGTAEGVDLFVKGFGDPRNDENLAGTNDIIIPDSKEQDGSTHIKFSIPLNSNDPNDFQHNPGREIWLILAYSISDDFDHHSRVREHIPITLN